MTSSPDDLLARLAGVPILGGCDDCDAVQRLEQFPGTRVWRLEIRHADDCPTYRRIRAA